MARIPAKQLGGLLLSVDAKKLDKFIVIEGENFILDAEGPRSAFGYTSTFNAFSSSEFVHSETLGDHTFYFAHNETDGVANVFTGNWSQRQLIHLFSMPELTTVESQKKFPWSTAIVGGLHYMCHLAFGVWQYDSIFDIWTNITANINSDLGGGFSFYAITEAGGRLIVLATGISAWSAIDDGTDFTPSTSTGSGAQSLAIIGTPTKDVEYKGCYHVSDGYLTVTQFGVLKSTLIDSINPFRHDPISNEHIPFNQNCVTQIATGTYVFLTQNGLYSTDGRTFTVWQPLMSEYLKLKEIPSFSLNEIGQVQLHYDFVRQWFFISISKTRNTNLFTSAFALYLPRDEWGVFNTLHRNFVAVDEFQDNSKISLAFITSIGKLALFSDTSDNILLESQGTTLTTSKLPNELYYAEAHLQKPSFGVNGVIIASSTGFSDSNEAVHKYLASYSLSTEQPVGWYELYGDQGELQTTDNLASSDNDDTTIVTSLDATVNSTTVYKRSGLIVFSLDKQLQVQKSLNASVEAGLFRLVDSQAQTSQQLTQITEVAIGMESADGVTGSVVDWGIDASNNVVVDWATISEITIDWGFALQSNSVYQQFIKGTLDGYAQFEDQLHTLEQVQLVGKTKFCTADTTGLYLTLQITAQEVGETFHLKDIEITANLAGRL